MNEAEKGGEKRLGAGFCLVCNKQTSNQKVPDRPGGGEKGERVGFDL